MSEAITPLAKVAQVAPRQPMGPPLGPPAPLRPRWHSHSVQQRPAPSASPAPPWEPCVGVREGTWGEMVFKCEDCSLVLDSKRDMVYHRMENHLTSNRRACGQCK